MSLSLLLGKSSPHERKVRKALVRAVVTPLLLMGILGGVFYYQTQRLLRLSAWLERTDRILAVTHMINRQVIELESGMRGYVFTDDLEFLEPFRKAEKELPARFEELNQLLREDPAQLERLLKIRAILADWDRGARKFFERRKAGESLVREIRSKVQKAKMDRIRAHFSDLIASEEQARFERRDKIQTNIRNTLTGTLLLALFWGSMLALWIRKQISGVSGEYEKAMVELNNAQRDLSASHAELEAKVAERTAALSSSNAELEAFCYSVSHDLRAPLRGIDGFSQALVEDYGQSLDDSAREYLRFVREGVQKMGKLIDNLLDLSRVSRLELRKEKLHLNRLAAEIISGLKRQEPSRNVDFQNILESEGQVEGDPSLIEALLENLLSNAWKFTSKRQMGIIQFGVTEVDGNRAFFVKDNGAGFDMAFENKLFGAFQRLHSPNEFKGTGVGLATVRRIAHRHGGKVWAEAAVDQGATFFFIIP